MRGIAGGMIGRANVAAEIQRASAANEGLRAWTVNDDTCRQF